MDDGDVLCDIYDVHTGDSITNGMHLTNYNQQLKEVKGTFQVTLIIDNSRPKCLASAPDTIRITNGEFYTKFLP